MASGETCASWVVPRSASALRPGKDDARFVVSGVGSSGQAVADTETEKRRDVADKPDYKSTMNLPQTEFPMRANLAKREPEWLEFWAENDIYAKSLEVNEGGETFILHDGPPYANGHIHMGTAFNKVFKDLIVKYKTMRGYWSPYVPGWDCHGQPIEHQVEKDLGAKKMGEISQAELRRTLPRLRDEVRGRAVRGVPAPRRARRLRRPVSHAQPGVRGRQREDLQGDVPPRDDLQGLQAHPLVHAVQDRAGRGRDRVLR